MQFNIFYLFLNGYFKARQTGSEVTLTPKTNINLTFLANRFWRFLIISPGMYFLFLCFLLYFTIMPDRGSAFAQNNFHSDLFNDVNSYANAYGNYNTKALNKFLKFDLIIIEPYNVPDIDFLKKLKKKGIKIIAYISVGEADYNRRYLKNWRSYHNTPDNPNIPRSKISPGNAVFLGENPGWPGSYYADTSNEKWHNIILREELPYILWLGGGIYDGFFLDVLDAAEVYKTKNNGHEMTNGLIKLIKKIKETYPDKILIANRGFSILKEIAPYIDALKYEEFTSAYGNIKNEAHYKKYYLKIDKKGRRINSDEIEIIKEALKINPRILILVLDHIKTKPRNIKIAKLCFRESQKLADNLNCKVLWYANAVEQDLPLWPEFKK